MCGINGILYLNGCDSEKPEQFHFVSVRKMNEAISHRGPDGEGIFIEYPIALGHRRLSIIDLSENGNQPMFNEDRSLVMVYNGEIYNYKELIPGLKAKGHRFSSNTDSEVILHAYEEYGISCVNLFNGMWAFAIYDLRKKVLFASRDRFGVKPFFYCLNEDRFIFSSEAKGIVSITGTDTADRAKVFNYLAYGYRLNDGSSFFHNIRELLPAHNLLVKEGRVMTERYWNFPDIPESPAGDRQNVRDLIFDSVALRYRSDVPVSILLSGGIDSGIIASVTNELIGSGMISNFSVSSYSAVFPGFEHDESKLIRELLDSCSNIRGHFVNPDAAHLAEAFPEFAYGMGEPVFSATGFAHYLTMKEIAKKGVKVVLNGQGADEAWCGYGRYIAGYFLLDILNSKASEFTPQFRAASEKLGLTPKFLALQIFKAMISRKAASRFRSKYSERIYECLSPELVAEGAGQFENPLESDKSGRLDSYLKYNICYQGFNQILHYEDHSSMQSSVEMRSPFVDYRIMELAFSIPFRKRFYDGITKKILRESFRGMLPVSIANNHKKTGFMTPFSEWRKKGPLQELMNDILNSGEFRARSIYKSSALPLDAGKLPSEEFPLWRLINLEYWIRAYGIKNL